MLVALSPFLAFIALDRGIGVDTGLFGAAAVATVLLFVDLVVRRRRAKILELGTLGLFGGLALYVTLSSAHWSVASVRLAVDAGLLSIVLGSMMLGQPFTIQYAREELGDSAQRQPGFIRFNYFATAVWAVAFGIMVAVDCAWVMLPGFSPTVVLVVSVAAVLAALRFPRWYVRRTVQGSTRLPG